MVVVLESDNRAVGEASGVQTRAVRVAVNPKEVISPGIGAPYLRRCPDDLIFSSRRMLPMGKPPIQKQGRNDRKSSLARSLLT